MGDLPLYQQIAEAVRRDILEGKLAPGDRLPSVRQMTDRWNCTPGTVQRAYAGLAQQGLVVSRAGQGTHVTGEAAHIPDDTPLRRAALAHRAEAFLLEAMAAGHNPADVETAVRQALEHWQAVSQAARAPGSDPRVVRFSGSHDPAVSLIAAHFSEFEPGYRMEPGYPGSLGGLMALVENRADFAGCHLWDEETGQYNVPFIKRLLPGETFALVTLAHRRLGWIFAAGSAPSISGLNAVAEPGVRFANRQPGSGTRVWLDAQLRQAGIDMHKIEGYFSREKLTHSDVARAVATGEATLGIGLEAAAHSYHLDFYFLTREVYHLVIPQRRMQQPPFARLVEWLKSSAARELLGGLHGYDFSAMGETLQVNP